MKTQNWMPTLIAYSTWTLLILGLLTLNTTAFSLPTMFMENRI
jgi:hypothetical protein